MSKQVKKCIPPTLWKTELRVHIEKEKLENPDTYSNSFVSTRQQQMRQEEAHRIPTNVPLIQVEIKPDGGHESVFVSPEHVSMRAEIDPDCDLLSPTDMAALFNAYFRFCVGDPEALYDPGFEVSLKRHKLLALGLVAKVGRSHYPTDEGKEFIEKMLEFHTTVFRPIRYEETFLPLPDNRTRCSVQPRPLRLMERRVNVSEERRIPENIWKRVP